MRDWIDTRVLWGVLLAWVTLGVVISPAADSVGVALIGYGFCYAAYVDPGPYESVRDVPARDVPCLVSLSAGVILFAASF